MNNGEILRRKSFARKSFDPDYLVTAASMHGDRVATRIEVPAMPPMPLPKHKLPEYLKPLPPRMTSIEIDYLFAKSALSLPETPVRNALLRAYLEFVHPYMPLIEVHEFLQIIEDGTGESGRISLLLFQAVMFAGTAFVDMDHLRRAGFSNRKAARKAFFQKARVCHVLVGAIWSNSAGSLRLRLRNRPRLPRAIPPADDVLVRNSRRPERHVALDGRGHFPGTYHRPTSKPRKVEYGARKEEAVEEDMVVMFYARSSGCTGDEETHEGQGRRL